MVCQVWCNLFGGFSGCYECGAIWLGEFCKVENDGLYCGIDLSMIEEVIQRFEPLFMMVC
jgi:hypothetical protein